VRRNYWEPQAGFYPDTLDWGDSRHRGDKLGVWGLCPQRGPGQSPWSGSPGRSPPELKAFCCLNSYFWLTFLFVYSVSDSGVLVVLYVTAVLLCNLISWILLSVLHVSFRVLCSHFWWKDLNLVHILWHLYRAHAIVMTKIVQDC